MKVKCPRCKEEYEVPSSLAGGQETCPTCGYAVPIPPEQPSEQGEADRAEITSAFERRKSVNQPTNVSHAGRKQCHECKEWIAKDAQKCPHCRTTQITPSTTIIGVLSIVGTILIMAWLWHGCNEVEDDIKGTLGIARNESAMERKLQEAMSYLNELYEVDWYEVDGNNVYIGFEPLPDDWQIVINGAALHGNKTTNFECHVWAINANQKGWRPGDGLFHGKATAYSGRLK